ncbi:MAG: hypothetical protein IKD85_03135 [Firmicutes bacterium]|nr:hypothetical protein [Bacillota bacterium]
MDGSRYCEFCGAELVTESSGIEDSVIENAETGSETLSSAAEESGTWTAENVVPAAEEQEVQSYIPKEEPVPAYIPDGSGSGVLSTGCKIWFWVVLVLNALSALISIFFIKESAVYIASLISGIGMCAGAVMILFQKKKLGFYVLLAMAAFNLLVSVISGTYSAGMLVGPIANALISYYFVRGNSDVLK